MILEYREMTISDFDQITKLWKNDTTMGFSESDTYDHLEMYFTRNPGMSFVACSEGTIIGTILCGHDGRRGFINHLYVDAPYRNSGIGQKLITLATEVLAAENPTKMYLFVKDDNEKAKTFWKRKGYYEVDEISVLRKSLSSEPFMVYSEFDLSSVIDYMLQKHYFNDSEGINSVEIGDGNMNMVFKVFNDTKSFIIKQSMPHGKINTKVYEPIERAKFEAMSFEIQKEYVPEYIPKHINYDEIMSANIYEDLSSMLSLRKANAQGLFYKEVGSITGIYLAELFFNTSSYGMKVQEKKQLSTKFTNYRLREITEDFMFTDPFYDADSNRIDSCIRPRVEQLWGNQRLKGYVEILKNKFISSSECLISGDFHPGNIFVSKDAVKFFDFEFAFFGPVSYDLGSMVGNLIINIMAQSFYHKEEIERYNNYLIQLIEDIVHSFGKHLQELFKQKGTDREAVSDIINTIEKDLIGFAGCNMIGRTYGYCQFSEITGISDVTEKQLIQENIIALAEKMICKETDFENLIKILKAV